MTDTDRSTRLEAACTALPLVAILRGLRPEESVEIAQTLYDAGFRLIEIPLNSPEPFDSIARVRAALPAEPDPRWSRILSLPYPETCNSGWRGAAT